MLPIAVKVSPRTSSPLGPCHRHLHTSLQSVESLGLHFYLWVLRQGNDLLMALVGGDVELQSGSCCPCLPSSPPGVTHVGTQVTPSTSVPGFLSSSRKWEGTQHGTPSMSGKHLALMTRFQAGAWLAGASGQPGGSRLASHHWNKPTTLPPSFGVLAISKWLPLWK